ncbi:tyrosine-type recombinase/integrase [Shewanella sp. Isolate13]|uniref:tyrosine-type recombinase/integrase n=1 Tax=Shewanella sp. Isolate13 TaxID=2908531 RepID=UPI001EFD143D|nr:tyrosine-type recombinase/integrase [Shewanella sp. Isolate13]MCG9729776.1 tyrosine-type recombinase/integrase [Shewanella sp. Isolate13]
MVKLIHSSSVFKKTNLQIHNNGSYHCLPSEHNIGSLPTLFSQDGIFLCEPNSYFFYLKAIKRAKDLSPSSRALLKYYQFLEDERLEWDHTPPIKRLKPTYLFRSYLLKLVKQDQLAYSTANAYMNHVKNFYLWAMHEEYLTINREQEAPFKIEIIQVQNQGTLAHIRPIISVNSSDLRIKVPKDSQSKNVRSLSPLSRESVALVASHLHHASQELKLLILLATQAGLRIEEASSLSLDALDSATPLVESEHRYEILLSPSKTGVKTKYGKDRHIEISAGLLNALDDYRISERRLHRANKLQAKIESMNNEELQTKQEVIEALELCERHEPLFISEQGNPVTSRSTSSRWSDFRSLIQKTDPKFKHRFHDLRATYGTFRLHDLLQSGLAEVECLELLMGWMGHKNERTTWKYLRYLKRKEVFKEKFALLDSIMHNVLGADNE